MKYNENIDNAIVFTRAVTLVAEYLVDDLLSSMEGDECDEELKCIFDKDNAQERGFNDRLEEEMLRVYREKTGTSYTGAPNMWKPE